MDDIDACKNQIALFINTADYEGAAAESVKNYLSDVHVTLLSSLSVTAQNLLDNIALYKAGYYGIDGTTNFILPKTLMGTYRSALNSKAGHTEGYGEEVNTALSQISDLLSLQKPDITDVMSAHEDINQAITELRETVAEQESSRRSDLISADKAYCDNIDDARDALNNKITSLQNDVYTQQSKLGILKATINSLTTKIINYFNDWF